MKPIEGAIASQASVVGNPAAGVRIDGSAAQAGNLAKLVQAGAQAIATSAQIGRRNRGTTSGDDKRVDAAFEKEEAASENKTESKNAKGKAVNVTA